MYGANTIIIFILGKASVYFFKSNKISDQKSCGYITKNDISTDIPKINGIGSHSLFHTTIIILVIVDADFSTRNKPGCR